MNRTGNSSAGHTNTLTLNVYLQNYFGVVHKFSRCLYYNDLASLRLLLLLISHSKDSTTNNFVFVVIIKLKMYSRSLCLNVQRRLTSTVDPLLSPKQYNGYQEVDLGMIWRSKIMMFHSELQKTVRSSRWVAQQVVLKVRE